ncbi:hypothetical protein HPB50_014087 [Hyalomma asiaticum]|uniref:Uncharacterized protein n=1 Tax=Hyalomma asiaticum TaxID=266040 RepID=A0ACB7S6J4_HYAAI|nr:hypothetical protein HPB50_014087 [Hyalomma asiaticum]
MASSLARGRPAALDNGTGCNPAWKGFGPENTAAQEGSHYLVIDRRPASSSWPPSLLSSPGSFASAAPRARAGFGWLSESACLGLGVLEEKSVRRRLWARSTALIVRAARVVVRVTYTASARTEVALRFGRPRCVPCSDLCCTAQAGLQKCGERRRISNRPGASDQRFASSREPRASRPQVPASPVPAAEQTIVRAWVKVP